MNPEFAIELVKSLIFQAVSLSTPILMTALSIGLGVSIFQATTSINEQTLSFVPKALGILGLIVTLLPWMIRTVMEFTRSVIEKMPQMVN